jgi:hypothetical protein
MKNSADERSEELKHCLLVIYPFTAFCAENKVRGPIVVLL